jgi:putative Ca2+/H+ antiporter (TMEM165/GDT1 family)
LVATALRHKPKRTGALIAAGVLVLAIGWCTALGPPTARTYLRYTAVGADEGFLYQLRLQILPDPAVRSVFEQRLGMPDCPAANAIAEDPVWRIEEFAAAYRSCPALAAWGAAHQDHAMAEFARTAPWAYARQSTVLFGQTLIGQHYASTPAVLPGRVIRIAFPSDPVAPIAIPIALVLAFALALVTAARRRETWWVAGLAAACLISSAGSVVFGVGEFKRFGVQEAIGLRLAILLFVAVALDAVLSRDAVGSSPSSRPTDKWENIDADRSTRGGVASQE